MKDFVRTFQEKYPNLVEKMRESSHQKSLPPGEEGFCGQVRERRARKVQES